MQQNTVTACFDKAQYHVGEKVLLRLPAKAKLQGVHIFHLDREILQKPHFSDDTLILEGLPAGGYGVMLRTNFGVWEGAFDIVSQDRREIRYGFLSDFSTENIETTDVEWMKNLHINTIQFYDWMYRHDQLLPPTKEYEDPLKRQMNVEAVSQKIEACKKYGIRPFAYGAVYAATEKTFREHPEWGMYTMDGQAMTFADWLYFMNIARESGWSAHIVNEYKKAIHFGFSGIHMDTYGFPKHVWTRDGRAIELAEEFPQLINRVAQAVRLEDSNGGVIFNAVNNWPTETVAEADQDAVYIEVWPPHDTYRDLYQLIREARHSSGKNVVLAAYLNAFKEDDKKAAERSFRFTWAAICASGGTQLVLGERHRLLRDSYYANYAEIDSEFLPVIQHYCDFLVRYKELLYNDNGMDIGKTASGGINEDIRFFSESCAFSTDAAADAVWTILRESPERLTILLINLMGNDSRWNKAKNEPISAHGISVRIRLDRPIRGIFAASPDGDMVAAKALPFSVASTGEGRIYSVELPDLRYWMAVWAELEG